MAGIKEKLGIAGEFFMSVGQAFTRRHVKEAIKAFGMIAAKYPNIQYLVACSDKYEPPVLEKLIGDCNIKEGRTAIIQTQYIGRDELVYLMNDTLAMVYVSDKEALGLPPLETLACGKPSVIADTPLAHELFGDEGFFVKDTNDPAAIAQQLSFIVERRADAARIVGLQKPYLERLSWSEHITRLFVMFDDVVNKR